jgi:hypothetical protein
MSGCQCRALQKMIVAGLLSQERLQSGSLNRDHSTKRGV